MLKVKSLSDVVSRKRSRLLLSATAAALAPTVFAAVAAFAQRPTVITSVVSDGGSPLSFTVYWETTNSYGFTTDIYGAESSTNDSDAVLEAFGFLFSDGSNYFTSAFTDVPQSYDFFYGVPGNHSAWGGCSV